MSRIDQKKLAEEYNGEVSLSYNFELIPIQDPDSDLARRAFCIYSQTTPAPVRTSTNDFRYRLKHKSDKFTFYLFALLLNDELIGMAMASHVKGLLIYDYIAIDDKYCDVYSLYFSYMELINQYIRNAHPEIDFCISEISANEHGVDITSVRFKQLLCIKGFGAITFPYNTLPLGNRLGTSFATWLYIKTNDRLKVLEKSVYLKIINSIYFDYYCAWYDGILTKEDYVAYLDNAKKEYEELNKNLDGIDCLPVLMPTCQFAECGVEPSYTASMPKPEVKRHYTLVRKSCIILAIVLVSAMGTVIFCWLLSSFAVEVYEYNSILPVLISTVASIVLTKKTKT